MKQTSCLLGGRGRERRETGGAGEGKRKGEVLWDNSFVLWRSVFFPHLPKASYDCFNGKLNDE